MKTFYLFLTGILAVYAIQSNAQTTGQVKINWQKTIGGNNVDVLSSISKYQTVNGADTANGYIVGGISQSDSSGDKTDKSHTLSSDYWILKINESGAIQEQRTIGSESNDYLSMAKPTFDNGIIMAGASAGAYGGPSGDMSVGYSGLLDCWVVKLDQSGTIQWEKTFGGDGYTALEFEGFGPVGAVPKPAAAIEQTKDGGYVLATSSGSMIAGNKTDTNRAGGSIGNMDYWILKLNSTGNIVWQKTLGGLGMDIPNDIHETPDNGFIIGGYSNSGIFAEKSDSSRDGINNDPLNPDFAQQWSFSYDLWILKLDNSGNITWQKTIGGDTLDVLKNIIPLADGGYIVGGYSYSGISGEKAEASRGMADYWILKLDDTGNILWQKTYGGSGDDRLSALELSKDGGFIVSGTTTSGISGDKTDGLRGGVDDLWILKLDSSGNIVWQRTIGGTNADWEGVAGMTETVKGGSYMVGAYSPAGISGDKTEMSKGIQDYWILQLCAIDSTVSLDQATLTANAHGAANYQWLDCNGMTAIQGATGQTFSPVSGGSYAVAITVDGCTDTSACFTVHPLGIGSVSASDLIKVYPNPSFDHITIALKTGDNMNKIEVLSFDGRIVKSISGSGKDKVMIDTQELAPGGYILKVWIGNKVGIQKFEVIR